VNDDLILGLDIGSSGVRAGLFDLGSLLPSTLVKFKKPLVGVEVNADEVLTNVIEAIDAVCERTATSKGRSRTSPRALFGTVWSA
jgi:sugar (pentulose or hexulose) kinase